jgi:hypothetical protein
MLSTDWATLTRLSAPRQIGETSKLSIVPRLMSSMNPIPTQPSVETASMTTTPGVRMSMYESPLNPPRRPGDGRRRSSLFSSSGS